MWQIFNPEIRSATLDFSSSGQGEFKVSQLYADDTQLINAIELVGWDLDEDQFLVCEACGYVHCKSGDWGSLRLAGLLILIIPAFDSYTESEEASKEYGPPWYIRKQGIAYFDLPTYESLRTKNSSFPSVSNISKLSMREAILTFQWEAPFQVLGPAPKAIAYRGDLISAASEGDVTECIRRIEEYAHANISNEAKAELLSLTEAEKVLTLYLDSAEFTEWPAVAFYGKELRLILDSKYLIVPEQAV